MEQIDITASATVGFIPRLNSWAFSVILCNYPEKEEAQTNPERFVPLGEFCEGIRHIVEWVAVEIKHSQ